MRAELESEQPRRSPTARGGRAWVSAADRGEPGEVSRGLRRVKPLRGSFAALRPFWRTPAAFHTTKCCLRSRRHHHRAGWPRSAGDHAGGGTESVEARSGIGPSPRSAELGPDPVVEAHERDVDGILLRRIPQRPFRMLRILARTEAASDTPARASRPFTLFRYRGKRSDNSLKPL